MKKLIFLLVLTAAFFNATVSAQSNVGVRLGANYSSFYGSSILRAKQVLPAVSIGRKI